MMFGIDIKGEREGRGDYQFLYIFQGIILHTAVLQVDIRFSLLICLYCRTLLELLLVPWLYTIEKNERICPFWGRFLIDSKYLYKEKEMCFGIIVQMWSRIRMAIPTIIWHIISYGVLKMSAFWRCHSINLT